MQNAPRAGIAGRNKDITMHRRELSVYFSVPPSQAIRALNREARALLGDSGAKLVLDGTYQTNWAKWYELANRSTKSEKESTEALRRLSAGLGDSTKDLHTKEHRKRGPSVCDSEL